MKAKMIREKRNESDFNRNKFVVYISKNANYNVFLSQGLDDQAVGNFYYKEWHANHSRSGWSQIYAAYKL